MPIVIGWPHRKNNPLQKQRAATFVHAFLLEHPCVKCGEADPVVLEFNHLDPQSKSANIADMIRGRCSAARLHGEIAKCEVVCANCHQRLTSLGRACHYKWQSPPAGTPAADRPCKWMVPNSHASNDADV